MPGKSSLDFSITLSEKSEFLEWVFQCPIGKSGVNKQLIDLTHLKLK